MAENTYKTNQLTNKVIVVTGASSGFGKGAALKFAEAGATVVLAARREDLLGELASACEAAGGKALAIPTDVSKLNEVEQLARTTVTQCGRIDVWVNNAGAGAIGRFQEIPLADHVHVIETDLLGTIYGSYFAMHHFYQQGAGILINIASIIGKVPAPYFSSYAAAKHGVVGFSAALRQELKEAKIDRIRVSTVMPTTFDTPFFEHAAQYTGKEAVPIPPTYDPKDVVDVIVRMAQDPEDEITVGAAAAVMEFAHRLFPSLTESMMARQTHKSEFEKAPPASETSGSLHEPMATGTDVRGGWKK